MKGRGHIVATRDGIAALRSDAPLAFRETADGLFMVGTAAGPIGGDDVTIEIEVAAGATLTLRSAAAALARPGRSGEPSRLRVHAAVAGTLRWLPAPSIAARGCRHIVEVHLSVTGEGHVEWRDELILGRDDEEPGEWTGSMRADVDGTPLLRQTLAIGADGWRGPAVLAGAKAVGGILVSGERAPAAVAGEGYAVMPLAGPGTLISAVAPDALTLAAHLDHAKRNICSLRL